MPFQCPQIPLVEAQYCVRVTLAKQKKIPPNIDIFGSSSPQIIYRRESLYTITRLLVKTECQCQCQFYAQLVLNAQCSISHRCLINSPSNAR